MGKTSLLSASTSSDKDSVHPQGSHITIAIIEAEELKRIYEKVSLNLISTVKLLTTSFVPLLRKDGFTYEAEAIRSWLERGHETSPMTNTKLLHAKLVPNLTLRSAIQEWLPASSSSRSSKE